MIIMLILMFSTSKFIKFNVFKGNLKCFKLLKVSINILSFLQEIDDFNRISCFWGIISFRLTTPILLWNVLELTENMSFRPWAKRIPDQPEGLLLCEAKPAEGRGNRRLHMRSSVRWPYGPEVNRGTRFTEGTDGQRTERSKEGTSIEVRNEPR